MPDHNPFTLTFGKIPYTYISRQDSVSTILDEYTAVEPTRQIFLITGVRGCGKTVLMTSVSQALEREGWIVVRLNPARNYLDELCMRLSEKSTGIPDITDRGFEVSVMGSGFSIGGTDSLDNVGKINRFLSRLKKNKKRVLITIDEVQNDSNLKEFALQFQIFLTEDYPVFLIMTGLYEDLYDIQNASGMTFLLRAPKVYPEPLGIVPITLEYKRIFGLEQEKARQLASITKGYAFAFQVLGSLYWEYRSSLSQQEILEKFDTILEEQVYRKIWEKLSDQDRAVIQQLLDHEEIKVQELRAALHMSSSKFSVYRDRLLKRGILNAPKYGYLALALPRFSNIARLYLDSGTVKQYCEAICLQCLMMTDILRMMIGESGCWRRRHRRDLYPYLEDKFLSVKAFRSK